MILMIACLYSIILASSHFWNLGWTKVNFLLLISFWRDNYCLIVIAESKTTTCGWRPVLHYIHLSVTRCKGVIKKVGIKSRNSAFSAKTYCIPCCWVKCIIILQDSLINMWWVMFTDFRRHILQYFRYFSESP